MKISVIIPVYSGEAYLRETLESVFAQTLSPHQVIAIDDGSTDSSPAILRAYADRMIIVRQKNQGVAAARNAGLAHASGDAIAFIDQDDLWPADRNRRMAEVLAANPCIDVLAGQVEIRDDRVETRERFEDLRTIAREFLVGSLLIRANVFRRLGPLNTNVGYADDFDFWIHRTEKNVGTRILDEVTLVWRKHDSNTSADERISRYHLLSVFRESLRRRRAEA